MPGEGGFFGGAGSGFGTSALLLASSSFREAGFASAFFLITGLITGDFGACFLGDGLFAADTLFLLTEETNMLFLLGTLLVFVRLLSLLAAFA